MLLPEIPWAGRIWALPFLTVLAPSEQTRLPLSPTCAVSGSWPISRNGSNRWNALMDKPTSRLTQADVLAGIKPVREDTNETARRVPGRIEQTIDQAMAVDPGRFICPSARQCRTGPPPRVGCGPYKQIHKRFTPGVLRPTPIRETRTTR
jgi:hypothetical protein